MAINISSLFLLIGVILIIGTLLRIDCKIPIVDLPIRAPPSSREYLIRLFIGIVCLILGLYLSGAILESRADDVMIDGMDSIFGWDIQPHDNGSKIYIYSAGDGFQANCLKIEYHLGPQKDAYLYKTLKFSRLSENMNTLNKIIFYFKATGDRDTLELQLYDGKDTWGYPWYNSTGAANWAPVEVKIEDIKDKWDNDTQSWVTDTDNGIDLNNVEEIGFMIRNECAEAHSGELMIDQIEGVYPTKRTLLNISRLKDISLY